MKKLTVRLLSAIGLLAFTFASVEAETLVWTGGGDNDNFSNPNNWNPVQAPASGDSLTFQGETRTTPYNDLDPASYTFADITFNNNNSAGMAAAFTLTGNKLRVSGSIKGRSASSGSIVDKFDLPVEYTTSKGTMTIGGTADNVANHGFTFKQALSGPSNAMLQNTTQYAAAIRFEGNITGFNDYYRPNGGSSIYLLGNNNAFTGTKGIHWGSGNLFIVDASNLNGATCFGSGQGSYATAGKLSVAPTNDVVLNLKLNVTGPSQEKNGLTIENTKEGPTLTIAGEVALGGTKSGVGSCLAIQGAGDGVFTGKFSAKNMAIRKEGTGTWTFSGNIPSFAPTGLVAVAAGKLCIDCATPTYAATVAKDATLTGSGSLGKAAFPATVTFASGAIYEVGKDADGALRTLTVTGTVSLAGNTKVCLADGVTIAGGLRTKLMTYDAKTGAGSFVVGEGFPEGTVFTTAADGLYVDVPMGVLTWTGAASSKWNTTDANWSGGAVYVDGAPVVFPDLADDAKRTVEIPSAVGPLSVAVSADGEHPYVFTGEGGVADASAISFTGTATNTWATPITSVPAVTVAAGKLILSGPVSKTAIDVAPGAALELNGPFAGGSLMVEYGAAPFKQSASSVISGSSAVLLQGVSSSLYGSNTFTGGLTVGDGSHASTLDIYSPKTLGSGGDVVLNMTSRIVCHANVAETNRTLHITGYNSEPYVFVDAGKTFDWSGDIVIHQKPSAEIFRGDGTVRLGRSDLASTLSVPDDRELTFAPDVIHLYAAFDSVSSFAFRGTLYLYNSKNNWSLLGINSGTCHTMADNVLPANKPIRLLQTWKTVKYTAELNLNGTSQTVAKITTSYAQGIGDTATFTSTKPATLTVKNTEDFAYSDPETFLVKGAVTLCKRGSAKWTLGVKNTSSGDLEVLEGTLSVTDAQSFPTGKKSVFRIADGAVLDLADGVAGEIVWAETVSAGRTHPIVAGLYGGPSCADARARKVDWISGTGTLRVRKTKDGGILVIVR